MPLTDRDVEKFELALKGPAPAWDPDWRVSKILLELVRVQADHILTLEERLQAGAFSQKAAISGLVAAIRGGHRTPPGPGSLTNGQVSAAVADLKSARQAAQSGLQIAQYAGAVLRFAARVFP